MLHAIRDGQHQWGTAHLCYLLAEEPSLSLIMAALCHDMAEQTVGDVPSPTKRILGMQDSLEKLENSILGQNGYLFPLTKEEGQKLELADRLEGCLTCVYERALGNRFVEVPYRRFRSYVSSIELGPTAAAVVAAVEELWQEVSREQEVPITYGR
jgi:5'-deoxynucleotidase YfbR-like HD superfamily hydrolase